MIETGPDEKIHPVAKLATIVEALAAEGVTLHDALRSIQLDASALSSPQTRVSLNQIIACCRNALSLSQDPLFAYTQACAFTPQRRECTASRFSAAPTTAKR